MPFIETHRSFVNTWQCDENDHMNVQFYFKNFAEAAEVFALRHKMDRLSASCPKVRHVRYLRELRNASSIAVKSAIISDGEHQGRILHLLENVDEDVVSAAALDTCDNPSGELPTVKSEEVAFALPRGIPAQYLPEQPLDELLNENKAVTSKYGIIQPAHCGINGEMLPQHYISHLTDGAPHVWNHIGLTTDFLDKHNYGRVAMEMKLSVITPAKVGAAIEIISFCQGMSEKTFTIHHQIRDIETGKAYATVQIINLIMDLEKRKAVPVPDFARNQFG
ncbi:MAG: thioesterase [Rhizobiaceae bacterium]